jgi:hypothetical protein
MVHRAIPLGLFHLADDLNAAESITPVARARLTFEGNARCNFSAFFSLFRSRSGLPGQQSAAKSAALLL